MRGLSEILATAEERSYARTSYRLHGAWVEAMAGNFADARQHAKEGRERFSELGLGFASGWGTLVSGYVEMLAGEPAEAERFMREAYEICRSTGDRWFLSTVLADLPHPVYAQGNYDAARALVEQINEVPAPADMEWQIKRRTAQAKVLARRGRVEEAELIAREAVDLAAQTDFVSFTGDAWCDLAEVLRVAERTDEATAAARHALQLYEDKGNVAAAASARHLIAELAG
jgi:tetratricopeptide (TPR) repeat protein